MQQGIGWPHTLNVTEGNEALLRLSSPLANQQSCDVTTPTGLSFNVQSPPSNRFESWSDSCGVRVRNIGKADEGRWRLTATRGDHSITGWTEVHVRDKIPSYSGSPISLQDGEMKATIDLTTLHNSYCIVAKPFSESSLVPGHCSVTLDRATRAVQGNWNVLLGLPGQVSELPVSRQIAVETERLDVGYVHDTSAYKLHMYCNVLHTTKNITFCRFQKTSESFGYNIVDGLSDGSHSYYGEGFPQRQCGMTIENPSPQDYGTWRCSLGLQMWVGTNIVQQNPMQALISVAPNTRSNDFRNNGNEKRKIFVQENMSFTIMCRAQVSLQYCWFQHPNGSQFTPLKLENEQQPFWYSGESLQTGDCGITFKNSANEDAGDWICHMGPRDQLGLEVTDQVEVRVTGPLAANDQEIEVAIGGEATLYCHTANGKRPLDYCRFLSPKRIGINIDSRITEANAILDRFYFTPGRKLDYGDCSLNIKRVLPEDVGEWACAAVINTESVESIDKIVLSVPQNAPQLRAGIIGMSVGLVVLGSILVAFMWYKYRPQMSCRPNCPGPNCNHDPNFQVAFRNRQPGSLSSGNSDGPEPQVQIERR
ncbi:uncharacterized protein [Epargyreus clarus]|uniref:uncharacterized protein n=1 Tax=Epargyreus clarus TaxID=520877 RepID=UPI003C2BB5DC